MPEWIKNLTPVPFIFVFLAWPIFIAALPMLIFILACFGFMCLVYFIAWLVFKFKKGE